MLSLHIGYEYNLNVLKEIKTTKYFQELAIEKKNCQNNTKYSVYDSRILNT